METLDKKKAEGPWITPRVIVGLGFVTLGCRFLLAYLGYVDSGE